MFGRVNGVASALAGKICQKQIYVRLTRQRISIHTEKKIPSTQNITNVLLNLEIGSGPLP
jgi:hypothetical protein